MPQSVFWSWQSDKPGKVSRHFIRELLERAVAAAGESLRLQESDRPGLDHDTKGEPGLVSIPESILAKIDRAAVFIGDVTPVAVSERGRHVANPNVLIELGYAKKALGPSQIILLWNEAWGGCTPDDLPFDLRHRRAPITYNLREDATRQEIARAGESLVSILADAIAQCLRIARPDQAEVPTGIAARSDDPSIWFPAGEKLKVNAGTSFGAENLTIQDGQRSYARIIPANWPQGIRPDLVLNQRHSIMPLGDVMGLNWGPTRGGLIVYEVLGREAEEVEVNTATQWFASTGELWGIDGKVMFDNNSGQTVVAATYILECWARFLRQAAAFYEVHKAGGPFTVKLGVTRLEGTWWPRNQGRFASTVAGLEPSSESDTHLRTLGPEEQRQCLNDGYSALREAYGLGPDVADLDRIIAEAQGSKD